MAVYAPKCTEICRGSCRGKIRPSPKGTTGCGVKIGAPRQIHCCRGRPLATGTRARRNGAVAADLPSPGTTAQGVKIGAPRQIHCCRGRPRAPGRGRAGAVAAALRSNGHRGGVLFSQSPAGAADRCLVCGVVALLPASPVAPAALPPLSSRALPLFFFLTERTPQAHKASNEAGWRAGVRGGVVALWRCDSVKQARSVTNAGKGAGVTL